MDVKNLNLLGLIGLIGAIIVIVGVFMTWLATDLLDYTISGWELYTEWTDVLDTKYTFLPLADLIFGIVVLALMIMPTFCNRDGFKRINNRIGLIVVIAAVVMLVISSLFIVKDIDVWMITIHIGNHLKMGFWMTLMGIALIIVGGFMPLAKNRLNITVKQDNE